VLGLKGSAGIDVTYEIGVVSRNSVVDM